MAQGARTAALCAPVPAGAPPLPLDGGARLGAAADGTADPLLAVVAAACSARAGPRRRRSSSRSRAQALLAHRGARPGRRRCRARRGRRRGGQVAVGRDVDGAVQLCGPLGALVLVAHRPLRADAKLPSPTPREEGAAAAAAARRRAGWRGCCHSCGIDWSRRAKYRLVRAAAAAAGRRRCSVAVGAPRDLRAMRLTRASSSPTSSSPAAAPARPPPRARRRPAAEAKSRRGAAPPSASAVMPAAEAPRGSEPSSRR